MSLVLARFLFGFSLSWAVAAVLIAATLLCIRLIGIAVLAFDDERHGNVAGAVCVSAIIVAALSGIYFLGHRLYDALGNSALVGKIPDWLAGANHLSPAAIFGAMTGFAVLACIPAWLNRPPAPPKPAAAKAPAGKAVKDKADTETDSAVKKTKAAAAKTAAKDVKAAPKGPRRAELGWTALFLLLIGGAVFAFAFSVDPLWPPQNATAAAIQHYHDMAARSRPVYLAAVGLLGGGALFLLAWLMWRRKD